MSHLNPGLISAYNSLTDKHLAGYFSNTRIRRHLQRAGLITRSGRIVPDKEYRHKLIQRAHQRHVRECLAQAIFHKVLEMERLHQIEIKRKLEEFARRERVHRIKVERSKRYEEDIIRILSPRPPTGVRGIQKQHSGPEGEHSESSESPSSSRPNTAPGKMQRPVRLKPIHSTSTTASVRRSSPYRLLESFQENDQPFNGTMDKESQKHLTTMEASHGISPYCLPVINNFVTPVPPATKRKERGVKVTRSSTIRGRRLRPTTASSGNDVIEDPPMLRSSIHQSKVIVNMVYFGKSVHLSHDLTDMRDDVKVFQQHCGGENLCVFKGKLCEGETFQFISRRHRGFPFSLTFFVNGLQVERLSSCCEFKHRKGSRLGGRHGHFGLSGVEGASPCYKCIIAMGLDKKPTPPPKRVKEDGGREESVSSQKEAPEMEAERTGEDATSHSECETSQPQNMETQVKGSAHGEDKVRDDYEEDFEADDEGPAEDGEAKEKKSPSPSSETERPVQEKDASETEDDEKDEDIKSCSGSSSSGSDQEESDAEAAKDSKEDKKEGPPKEVNQEEAATTEGESARAKDSDMQDSAGDSTEIEISDTSVPSGNENRQSDDASADKDAEKMVQESKHEQEQERAKSVQEKLAEAILKESQCSSEPELSDTSTEESIDEGPKQDSKDAVPEKLVAFAEQQETIVEETKCEDSVTGEGETAQEQEEANETKEQKDETEREPCENSSNKDEKVDEVEEAEKTAESEATSEKDKSEDMKDKGEAPHPVNEENMAQDDKTANPLEEPLDKSTNAEAAEEDEEKEEKAAVETDVQHDEIRQGAKSREEDESSVSEQNKKTDEPAVPDNAEAEAMTASETTEIKAETPEEREALNCEETPVTNAEKTQQAESEERTAESETEVTAENSSSLAEGSRETTVEKTIDTNEKNTQEENTKDDTSVDATETNAKDESSKGDFKEEAEETSGAKASKDGSQQEEGELGEETVERSVEVDEKVEEHKSEKDGQEDEKQTQINPDNTGEDENEERVKDEEDLGKADESIDKEENIAEGTENNTNTERKEAEDAEETLEEDQVAKEEEVEEPRKTQEDQESECADNKTDMDECEAKGADKNNKSEERSETNTDVEEKDNDAEKSEKNEPESTVVQSGVMNTKHNEECEEREDAIDKSTGEGDKISTITGDTDLNKENVKLSHDNIVKSEDAGDNEPAEGTETSKETLNNMMEADNVKMETEIASNTSEKVEIDAENGEISNGAESKTREIEGEAPTKDEHDLKTGEHGEEERKTEEFTEDEDTNVKDGVEKQEDDKVDQAPVGDMIQRDGKDRDGGAEKHGEPTKNDSEPEESDTEIKEDPKLDGGKGSEGTEDEDVKKSDLDDGTKESDLVEKNNNIQNNDSEEEKVASSENLEQSLAPISVELDGTSHQLDEHEELEEMSEINKHSHANDNVVAFDPSAADGENGADTEEASKASEEGASVLLKPQAQNEEADNAGQSVILVKGPPQEMVEADNTDLVTNWVNMHQSSKFFETFVEPLEDLREISEAQVSNSKKEETQCTEELRSEIPLEVLRTSEDEEKVFKLKDESESRDKTRLEAVESDLGSIHAGDKPSEIDPAKDIQQIEEKTEGKDLISKAETEQNDREFANQQETRSEEHKGSRRSLEENKAQAGPSQSISEEKAFSKTEVESISGTHHSLESGKRGSVSESQTDEKTTNNDRDFNVKETAPEEMKDLPSSKTEAHPDSKSPDGVKDTDEAWERPDEQSREITEITDFTTSKSDDGSQEESNSGEMQHRVSEGSISRDRRELIQDIKHTLSKDQLSSFSLDDTLFGRSSLPLLTTASTGSGH